jgi:hypothetical protein
LDRAPWRQVVGLYLAQSFLCEGTNRVLGDRDRAVGEHKPGRRRRCPTERKTLLGGCESLSEEWEAQTGS